MTHPSWDSHHLGWSQDICGVMLIPRSKAVAIATGLGQGSCLGHIPEGWKGWGAGRQGRGSPGEVPFLCPRVLLQELLVFGAFVLKPDLYLGLGEAELRRQLGPLGQRQVLRVLEALVQVLQLQARVDGPGLAQLLGGGLPAPLRGL